ncbi:MmcQ/YjbR family DNA-binding protein [Pedobacter cryophilus]|uniref:MmcQ/YjbR family DNA-binding protein n=1 Tax=Pedobacter cryophilus TaxID=2571271 RepID=A0A4U1BX06_9SPHI|nr:MmcQ/YjbR family DNA-binding protein [Pedobacter cryophilus]TKB97526.1 MmcQ/YjbR family DNA-binding protein [Pedobacter cryophilus]
MVSLETFRQLALSFKDATEEPHFEKASFRVKKKIFATLDVSRKQAVLKLSEIDQSVFSSFDQSIIYPVANKWGKQGWTVIELEKVREDMLKDALTVSYFNVAK